LTNNSITLCRCDNFRKINVYSILHYIKLLL